MLALISSTSCLMPNAAYRCSIAVTGARENFIQFVAIQDFTYWLRYTAWRHSSRVAIGTAST